MTHDTRTTTRSITKTVQIDCAPERAFAFLADLGNWPRWAVVNVKSTSPSGDPEWWDMITPHGTARLRMRADALYGILDHDFVDPQPTGPLPPALSPMAAGRNS